MSHLCVLYFFCSVQSVYFLTLEEGLISERYLIGGTVIANDLYVFNKDLDRFAPVAETNLLVRRSDLMGSVLSVYVAEQVPYLTISTPPGKESSGSNVTLRLEGGSQVEIIHPTLIKGMFWELLVRFVMLICSR